MSANNGGSAIDIKKVDEKLPRFPDMFASDPFFEFMGFRPNFRPFFDWAASFPLSGHHGFAFDIDLKEKDGKYVAECALPGFKKEEIDIQVRGKNLTITAKTQGKTESKAAAYLYRERHQGEYCRTLAFPEAIDPKQVEAFYRDGILEVSIPMTQQKPAQKIDIKS
jgi:HSP20 family protein